MALRDELAQVWENFDRQVGQLFMMGFSGTTVNDQIKSLIEDYHVGSILLTAQNLKSAEEATQLILELQHIAHQAGHPFPLAIALDQENGGLCSLFDEVYIRPFPSAMGLAATGSTKLAKEVAKATGQELNAVGVNWILGPVLNVSSNVKNQPLGVRAIANDPQDVSSYGVEFMRGYQEAGLATCGKYFPSYGGFEYQGGQTNVPLITESLEQLSQGALIPFNTTISQGLDAVMVGGASLASNDTKATHACLSERVVQDLLRTRMSFNGVVVSKCLEMEPFSHNIAVRDRTTLAVKAGCDIVLLYSTYTAQQEAIISLKSAIDNAMIDRSRIQQSLVRVLAMKSKWTSWEKALNPAGIEYLTQMQTLHTRLSTAAYNGSITVVRDQKQVLPLARHSSPMEEILLLTPLLKPLPASAASRLTGEESDNTPSEGDSTWHTSSLMMSGEQVFQELGRAMSRQRSGRVLHTSYTAHGLRPVHEDLINRVSAVVVVTADAGRNLYQNGFTKHVSMICQMSFVDGDRKEKPFIVVAVSSPYDFAFDQTVETYICTYDFTEPALQALVRVLYGELHPTGALPGIVNGSQKVKQSRQRWLVENWNEERDAYPLEVLLKTAGEHQQSSQRSILSGVSSQTFLLRSAGIEEAHLVVRDSNTRELYGFCSTYYFRSDAVGVIGSIIVDPSRRHLSVGHALHSRAMRGLTHKRGIRKIQLGSRIPSIFLGIPSADVANIKKLKQWFTNIGWNIATSQMLSSMILRNLPMWSLPDGLSHTLSNPDIKFDLVYGTDHAEPVLEHVRSNSRTGIFDIYKLALADKISCGIIRAKRPDDGSILGSLVLYKNDSKLASFVPALADTRVLAGGISSPVICPSVIEPASLIQGLILLGIRQIKKQGAGAIVLDCIESDEGTESLSALGFSVLHTFEGITCESTSWAMMPTS